MTNDLLPDRITDVDELDELLSRPSTTAITAMRRVPGDLILLGVAGKMGPTLARMVARATESAGVKRRIIGVSRFSDPAVKLQLRNWGIETIEGDLLDPQLLASLPDAPNVIYLAGMKFGSAGKESLTWAMNSYLPSLVCQRYRNSRIVAFSTGNVYGFVPVDRGGSIESDVLQPVGEYAMSCLGRERIFEYFSRKYETPMTIFRLNYATELRYGVLVDLARKVWEQSEIDLTMGHVNVIWQGDANAMALGALLDTASPPDVINIAGSAQLRIRDVSERFGQLMDRQVRFAGTAADSALLSNGTNARQRYGPVRVNEDRLIQWIAAWVQSGGKSFGKPTHFESRDGKY